MSEEASLETDSADTRDTTDEAETSDDGVDTTHLDDIEPGAGCTEIWEHLSERREHADSD
jgi:hypothetical protein